MRRNFSYVFFENKKIKKGESVIMKKTGLAVLISIMICAIAIMGTMLFIKFYQDGKENNQREEMSAEAQEKANT